MAKGLSLPLRVNSLGGTDTTDGDDQARKIINLALGDGDNENAFQQDVALGEVMIFGLNNTQLRASIVNRLRKISKEFEEDKLYKLMMNTVKFNSNTEGNELTLSCNFINLETDTPFSFQKTFSSGV